MGTTFRLRDEDIKKLQDTMIKFQKNAEYGINDYLRNSGKDIAMEGIENYTPVSNRNKKHAKGNRPYHAEFFNLAVRIGSRRPYGYLYFQQEGRGEKANLQNEEYMDRGLESRQDEIVNGLLEAIERSFKDG